MAHLVVQRIYHVYVHLEYPSINKVFLNGYIWNKQGMFGRGYLKQYLYWGSNRAAMSSKNHNHRMMIFLTVLLSYVITILWKPILGKIQYNHMTYPQYSFTMSQYWTHYGKVFCYLPMFQQKLFGTCPCYSKNLLYLPVLLLCYSLFHCIYWFCAKIKDFQQLCVCLKSLVYISNVHIK